jgi:hypothetical protein
VAVFEAVRLVTITVKCNIASVPSVDFPIVVGEMLATHPGVFPTILVINDIDEYPKNGFQDG